MKSTFHSSQSALPEQGFTIIELLVVVAILGVLAALAAPSFTETIKRYRVNGVRENLTSSIQWARSEAIKRRLPIILERTTGCEVTLGSVSDWSCGWRIFVDGDPAASATNAPNGVFNAGETILQVFTVPTGIGLLYEPTVASDRAVVNRFGQPAVPTALMASTQMRFVITPPEGSGGAATTSVCFYPGGRLSTVKGTPAC